MMKKTGGRKSRGTVPLKGLFVGVCAMQATILVTGHQRNIAKKKRECPPPTEIVFISVYKMHVSIVVA